MHYHLVKNLDVTGLRVYARDNSSLDFSLELVRTPLFGSTPGAPQTMARVNTSALTPGLGTQNVFTSAVTNPKVDLGNYMYALHTCITSDAMANNNLALYGAVVFYN